MFWNFGPLRFILKNYKIEGISIQKVLTLTASRQQIITKELNKNQAMSKNFILKPETSTKE